jgi:hypothetical protein
MDADDDVEMLNAFAVALSADIEEARKALDDNDSQFLRRGYIRALFAAIEGMTHFLKQYALEEGGRYRGSHYSDAEIAMLKEESYTVNSKGQASIQVKFIPIEDNFRFALDMFMRVYGTSLALELGGVGWHSFKKSLAIRNRITHPRRLADLAITDKELSAVRETHTWFDGTIGRHFEAAIEAEKALLDRSQTSLEKLEKLVLEVEQRRLSAENKEPRTEPERLDP